MINNKTIETNNLILSVKNNPKSNGKETIVVTKANKIVINIANDIKNNNSKCKTFNTSFSDNPITLNTPNSFFLVPKTNDVINVTTNNETKIPAIKNAKYIKLFVIADMS